MFTPMEFHPTLYEVEQANRFFWNYMKKEAECIMLPESEAAHMSLELAVRCAAANVWKHARMYQEGKVKKKEVKEVNEILNISGIECFEKDGTAYLKLETVARGLGFTTVAASGNEVIRWNTVHKYLCDLGVATSCNGSSYQNMCPDFIPENIFYRLAMKAKNETAEKFQAFVADEIIPSIRRHGIYATAETVEKMLSDPDTAIRLLNEIKSEREKRIALEEKAEQDKPLIAFANSVSVARTSILIGELAKLLKQNGIDMGQNRLFAWMREKGYLISRKGTDYNMPTQRSMERGLFEIKESTVSHADGHTSISKTPNITGKGQIYFINLFLGEAGA